MKYKCLFPIIIVNLPKAFEFQTTPDFCGDGRVVRWCWVNFQCRGVLLIWIIVGQGPTVLAVGAGRFGHFFSRLSFLSSFSLSLGDGPM